MTEQHHTTPDLAYWLTRDTFSLDEAAWLYWDREPPTGLERRRWPRKVLEIEDRIRDIVKPLPRVESSQDDGLVFFLPSLREEYDRSALTAWCIEFGQRRPLFLFPEDTGQLPDNMPNAMRAAWAAYHTFWINPDPHRPPKRDEIIAWLMRKWDLSRNQSEAVDLLIRPDDRRKGGNTPRPQ